MELYGKHFVYDNLPSSAYNLVLGNVETSEQRRISGESNGRYIYNKRNNTREYAGEDRSNSPLTFDVEIVSMSDKPYSISQVRDIENWLFGSNRFRVFALDPNCYTEVLNEESETLFFNGNSGLYLKCRFTNPEKVYAYGGVIGFKCTLEANTDMWLWDCGKNVDITEDMKTAVDVYDNNGDVVGMAYDISLDISVDIDSDTNSYTYPIIRITCDDSDASPYYPKFIDIWNYSDIGTDNQMFSLYDIDGEVYIDCNLCYVQGGTMEKPASYSNVRSHSFTRFVRGENVLSIYGSGIQSIEVEWINKRYL